MSSKRIAHLEAIRGIAAMQVLLLHTMSAFAPGLVFFGTAGWLADAVHLSPLFLLYDGYSAVYIFFALSGYVLTHAFAGNLWNPIGVALGRAFRFAVPAVFACLLAVAIMAAVGHANVEAGEYIGSAWLRDQWTPPAGAVYFVHDALVNGILIGYAETSPFPGGWISPIAHAYVAPMWTLSIELHGSILVFVLCAARARSRTAWVAAVLLAGLLFVRTHYIPFVAGHILASAQVGRQPSMSMPISLGLIALGSIACFAAELGQAPAASWICGAGIPGLLTCTPQIQKTYGAMLIFVGLVSSPLIVGAMSAPLLVRLGRLSFSIYLVHWAVIFGIGSATFIALRPMAGDTIAVLAASAGSIVASFFIAVAFTRIDDAGVAAGRFIRTSLGRRFSRVPLTTQSRLCLGDRGQYTL